MAMEALDGHRQRFVRPAQCSFFLISKLTFSSHSGILSLMNREKIDRINTDRTYTSAPTMAAMAVVSPTSSIYSNGPPPSYSGWSGPAHSSGLISPPDSRRTSDDTNPHRQSLPSIHEALSSGPKSNPYASPVSASLPSSHQLPYSQSQPPSIPRSYPPADHAQYPTQLAPSQPRQPTPPQPIHPQANPFSRSEHGSGSFSEMPRHPSMSTLQAAPAPHNPYAGPRYEPPPVRHEQDPRAAERAPNGYTHHPPPQQQPSYAYGPGPNQVPSAGPHTPVFSDPRYQHRDSRDSSDGWRGPPVEDPVRTMEFRHGLKRNLDVWDFENNLTQVGDLIWF